MKKSKSQIVQLSFWDEEIDYIDLQIKLKHLQAKKKRGG